MKEAEKGRKKVFGASFRTVDLGAHFNWPPSRVVGQWWRELKAHVQAYPQGRQQSWGMPFRMGEGAGRRVILVKKGSREVTVELRGMADFLCLLHQWRQVPEAVNREQPAEGLVVGEYVLSFSDGTEHVQPVRARFEVAMVESPGPTWVANSFRMPTAVDPTNYPEAMQWGTAQTGVQWGGGGPLVYAMPNPHPRKRIRSLTVRGFQESPLLVAGLTLYRGASHPLRHLPRRSYRVVVPGGPAKVEKADVDLGTVVRVERTKGPRGKGWLRSPYSGLFSAEDPSGPAEDVVEAIGSEDATLSTKLEGRRDTLKFSLGEAFHRGNAPAAGQQAKLQVLDKTHQWMQVTVKDASSGKPVPVRIHFSGPRGQYIAPYGHHSQINTGWFMDYGADVVAGGQNFAYVPGQFTMDMPVGDVYVEVLKGFEYEPLRQKVTIKRGQKGLELSVERKTDWRSKGWVTADTHVHFVSPQTAWLEAQGEGVNVVNLLASQWGRLFTNVGDLQGRVGVVEDDTIVWVGTENRNHMLGHMSMLGTQGLPVYPMCCGGPGEAWLGDPDFLAMAEWALENKRKGGVVIRPHFPGCGHTEDPVPILKGLVDALEIRGLRGSDFPTQEWYRYLNCGYRVAVAGGTDKMGAYCPIGWMRTYALLDTNREFAYENWAQAVRGGRTFASTGPLIDMHVEGAGIGDAIELPPSGGTLQVDAHAESVWPLGSIEIVCNGRVVAAEQALEGAHALRVASSVSVTGSGWIAARCTGLPKHPGAYIAAHTSPVYVKCGSTRAFDGAAAQHMLALVNGGIEYLQTLATVYDEASRKRMVKLYKEAQQELEGRLLVEAKLPPHHGHGPYHTHGHGEEPGHRHE